MFFVNIEVLVKFKVQNLERINMCGTFVEFKRKKRKTFKDMEIGNKIML